MITALWNQYGGGAVFVSSGTAYQDQTTSGAIQQISRVQSVSLDINYPLQDQTYLDGGIDSYNVTNAGADAVIDFYNTQGTAERFLGFGKFNASGELVLGFEDERNLYLSYQNQLGQDANGAAQSAPRTVIALSQGLLTSYQLSAQVGGFINARASLNYLTAFVYTGASGQQTPTIDPRNGDRLTGRFTLPPADSLYNPNNTGYALDNTPAIAARDMVMIFGGPDPFGVSYTGAQAAFLQSFQLGLSLNRQQLKPLGYAFPQARPTVWPIQVDLNTEAIMGKYQADELQRLSCTTTGFAVTLLVKQPCSAVTTFGFSFNNLQLVSQSFGNSIGPLNTVRTTWRGFLQSPSDTFISPFWNTIIRLDTSGEWGTTW